MKKNRENQRRKQFSSYIRFSGIAFQMGAVIFAGAYIGSWLDKKYPNKNSWFTIATTLFAVLLSLYIVVRQLLNLNKDDS